MGQRGACARKSPFNVHVHFPLSRCPLCGYGSTPGLAVPIGDIGGGRDRPRRPGSPCARGARSRAAERGVGEAPIRTARAQPTRCHAAPASGCISACSSTGVVGFQNRARSQPPLPHTIDLQRPAFRPGPLCAPRSVPPTGLPAPPRLVGPASEARCSVPSSRTPPQGREPSIAPLAGFLPPSGYHA